MVVLAGHWALGAAEGSYTPTTGVRFCNALSSGFPDTVAGYNDPFLVGNPGCADPGSINTGTAYDLTLEYGVGSGQLLPGGPAPFLVPADGYVSADPGIADGAKVGGIAVSSTVSILNSACNLSLTSEYTLFESTTSATNTIIPPGAGTPDRLAGMATDGNGDGMAEAGSLFVTKNPSFYPRLFDPDLDSPTALNGPLPPVQPVARYSGMSRVPQGSGAWSIASIFAFSSQALSPFSSYANNVPHAFARIGRAPADAAVLLLAIDDPMGVGFGPASVTEVCSPLAVKMMLKGTASTGEVRSRTPTAPGSRIFSSWSYSDRDADGDGIGNWRDTCPYAGNSGSDSDLDRIDNACDAAYSAGNTDVDLDGYQNLDDNCPQWTFFSQVELGELTVPYSSSAPYGGPRTDGIGDQCDAAPTVANGAFIEHYASVPKCIGGTDADGDGYCAAEDPNDGSASVKGFSLNGGPDQDGVPSGDGFGANVEVYVGTAPLVRCPATATPNDEPIDAWPADFDDNQSVNTTDVLALKAWYGSSVPPAPARHDIVPSKSVNTSDVLAQKPHFGTSCTLPP